MAFSKSVRRVIAGLAAGLTLFCQTSALAHACSASAAGPASAMMQAPCHDAGEDTAPGTTHDAYSSPCLAQAATSPSAVPDIPMATGVPIPVVRAERFRVEGSAVQTFELRRARSEAPPLTILHCCLRN